MKKALITGVSGQDGAYLARLLLDKGYDVYGGLRRTSQDSYSRLRALGLESKLKTINFDLTDPYNVCDCIKSNQFHEVYNLAAQSFVGSSWDLPLQTTDVNALGSARLLDSIKRFSPETKFYQASTSEMFGRIQEPMQSEDTPFYPRSPYGVSKLYSHWLTVNYRESHGIFACSGILFNHESPLRGHEFVTKKIVSTLLRIKLGEVDTLYVGNLNAKRDWGYAKEYVEGMWRMLQADEADDYVLATGETVTVRRFVEYAAAELDLNLDWEGEGVNEVGRCKHTGRVIVKVSEEFFRPAEVDVLLGSASKAKDKLNWQAETKSEKLAKIMVRGELELRDNGELT